MPIVTAAITALGLSATPTLPGGPYTRAATSGSRTYSGAYTKLSLNGASGLPYGASTPRSPTLSARTYSAAFTRLSLAGTPAHPYGSFAGKAETTSFDKAAFFSIVPVVTIGEVNDIDVDTPLSIIPRVALSATVTRALSANFTVRPVLTQSRGQVNSTGTTPKSAGLAVKPVLTLSANVREVIASSLSVVPVVSLSSVVDDAGKFATHSVIPVVTINAGVNRVNASQAWSVAMVARPVARMSSAVRAFGEVDRINFTASPKGRIRITKV